MSKVLALNVDPTDEHEWHEFCKWINLQEE